MEIKVTVPDWVRYKAMDSDGLWHLYETLPVFDDMGGWDNPERGQMLQFMIEPFADDWENTSLAVSAKSLASFTQGL